MTDQIRPGTQQDRSGRSPDEAEPHRPVNRAQAERHASDQDIKRVADMPSIRGGEKWAEAKGHSGTRRAWVLSVLVLVGAVLIAFGMTVGPFLLVWIGIAAVVLAGGYSLVSRTWSDYESG
jgi:hypothetical protein